MGEVIAFRRKSNARPALGGAGPLRALFAFDLACPFSYLAAERVDRTMAPIRWRPALAAAIRRTETEDDGERARAEAERRAAALRLPLVWPERWPASPIAAMRAADWAAAEGRGADFALAAARLAFCGGFDLDDPEVLVEAAAAADLDFDSCLAAARDPARDERMAGLAQRLLAGGADRLPVLVVNRSVLAGERRIADALLGARLAGRPVLGDRRRPAAT